VVKTFKHGVFYDAWLAGLREQGGRVIEAADFDTVVRLFKAGRVDAFLALPTSWLLAARQHGLAEGVDLLDWAPQERVVHGLIASRLRVPEPDRRRLREALSSLLADGTVAAILNRHAGADVARTLLLADGK
jgi:polar amino acid transport system substrate-binding protein